MLKLPRKNIQAGIGFSCFFVLVILTDAHAVLRAKIESHQGRSVLKIQLFNNEWVFADRNMLIELLQKHDEKLTLSEHAIRESLGKLFSMHPTEFSAFAKYLGSMTDPHGYVTAKMRRDYQGRAGRFLYDPDRTRFQVYYDQNGNRKEELFFQGDHGEWLQLPDSPPPEQLNCWSSNLKHAQESQLARSCPPLQLSLPLSLTFGDKYMVAVSTYIPHNPEQDDLNDLLESGYQGFNLSYSLPKINGALFTEADHKALAEYTDLGGYGTFNSPLRGKAPHDCTSRALTNSLVRAMRKFPSVQGIPLYRGLALSPNQLRKIQMLKPGDKVIERGFMSTATTEETSKTFEAGDHPFRIKIQSSFSGKKINPDEDEVTFEPSSAFEVISVKANELVIREIPRNLNTPHKDMIVKD